MLSTINTQISGFEYSYCSGKSSFDDEDYDDDYDYNEDNYIDSVCRNTKEIAPDSVWGTKQVRYTAQQMVPKK